MFKKYRLTVFLNGNPICADTVTSPEEEEKVHSAITSIMKMSEVDCLFEIRKVYLTE